MLKAIAKPFGVLMLWLYNITGNYGVAIILFALVVKLITLPFQLKSKKSMMRVSRLTPKLKELEKKYGNDQQRYQQEMAKLYQSEGANPMSGCLWSLLPFPILIALYQAIRYPITTMMGVGESFLAEGGAILQKLGETGFDLSAYSTGSTAQFYSQIYQSQFITEHWAQFKEFASEGLQQISYQFLGLDLGQVPRFSFWNWDWSSPSVWGPTLGLFLIPLLAGFLQWLSVKVSSASTPQTKDQASQMRMMNLLFPLMSVYFCFTMPGVMGVYWCCTSLFAMLQDVILNKVYTKQLDVEDADRIEREKAKEAEIEAKRQQTEKLKAEGATVENKNTSKKNKKAVAAQKEVERKAAEARAARLAKKGVSEEDIPASQVGDRRYARGRAYVPDRYTNPAEAEEKTKAAAAASEAYGDDAPPAEVSETAPETVEGVPETTETASEALETEEAPEQTQPAPEAGQDAPAEENEAAAETEDEKGPSGGDE